MIFTRAPYKTIETDVQKHQTLITTHKRFCPSVFCYIASVVPAIWFLELHEMQERIDKKDQTEEFNKTIALRTNNTLEPLSVNIKEFGDLKIHLPIYLPRDLWLRVLEQFLLLMLIVGRWLLPKGALSHDQLSQLLLVYLGTAADIVEFYEAFNEENVKYNRILIYTLLGIWTLSLLQFTLVLTATRARRDHAGVPAMSDSFDGREAGCCNPEIYGIIISIFMQDCPFLVIRLLLIFKYKVVSYTNMFFTAKNTLVIILLLYRLIVIQTDNTNGRKSNGSPVHDSIHMIGPPRRENSENSEILLKPSRSSPCVNNLRSNATLKSYDSCPRFKTLEVKDRRSDPIYTNKIGPGSRSPSANRLAYTSRTKSAGNIF
ncbi:hypothetical protein FSP39_013334 [Pinctada imbricata]|uniref:Transmembrane protein 26 n=1 Tax=Pinctada imbricata TaxID=66713 RepID=A0AA88YSX8_PINIB|nr:hypothetical protein FSP39_013334 [Pinctada imbricata]